LKRLGSLFRCYGRLTIPGAVTEAENVIMSILTRIGPNIECAVVVKYLVDFFKAVDAQARALSIIVGYVNACEAKINAADFQMRRHKGNKKTVASRTLILIRCMDQTWPMVINQEIEQKGN
jgi:hypothetical protein